MASNSEQTDLTTQLKGSRRAYVAEFIKHRELVAAYLQQGHSYRSVFEHLSDSFSFGYDTFRRYAAKLIPESERTPPPLRRSLNAGTRLSQSVNQPTGPRASPSVPKPQPHEKKNTYLTPRERPPFDYSKTLPPDMQDLVKPVEEGEEL